MGGDQGGFGCDDSEGFEGREQRFEGERRREDRHDERRFEEGEERRSERERSDCALILTLAPS